MKTVRSHRYAQLNGTRIYASPNGKPIATLPGNTWIGVVGQSDGWFHVITAHTDGWVRQEECTIGKHAELTSTLPANKKHSVLDYGLRA